jgi:hypothetical protein
MALSHITCKQSNFISSSIDQSIRGMVFAGNPGSKNVAGLNWLMGTQPSLLDNGSPMAKHV